MNLGISIILTFFLLLINCCESMADGHWDEQMYNELREADEDYHNQPMPPETVCGEDVAGVGPKGEVISCCCIRDLGQDTMCSFHGKSLSYFDPRLNHQGVYGKYKPQNPGQPLQRATNAGKGVSPSGYDEDSVKNLNLAKYQSFKHGALIIEWEEDFCVLESTQKPCGKFKSYPTVVTVKINDNDLQDSSVMENGWQNNLAVCFETLPFFEGRIRRFLKPKLEKKLDDLVRLFKLLEDNLIDPEIFYQPAVKNLKKELMSEKNDLETDFGITYKEMKDRLKKIRRCSSENINNYKNCIEEDTN